MKNPKSSKPAHTGKKKGGPYSGDWHVAHTSMGMGDYYGSGIKQKIGKVIRGTGVNGPNVKNLKKPPKTLA